MAPLPAVAKVVRVDLHHAISGDTNAQVRTFFKYSGTLSLGDAVTWTATIQASWGSRVAVNMVTVATHRLTRLTDLTSNTAPQVENATPTVGTDANPIMAGGTALIMKHHIARRYRGGHSRIYIPGYAARFLSTPTSVNGTLVATVTATYANFINDVVTGAPVAVGTITHVNVSYFQGFTVTTPPGHRPIVIPTPRPTPVVDTIDNISFNPAPGSQRRRNETP